jgi:uncharacterized protein YjbI with pentapeptide repeats
MTILNRFNDKLICELKDIESNRYNLSEADLSWADLSQADLSQADLSWADLSWSNLSVADLSRADLSWADLSRADLSWADLSRADLSGAIGNNKEIKTIQTGGYITNITDNIMWIGCEGHTFEQWNNFSENDIRKMDGDRAIVFWAKYKDFLFNFIEINQGETKLQ